MYVQVQSYAKYYGKHNCRTKVKVQNLKRLSGDLDTVEKLASNVILNKNCGNKCEVLLPRQTGGHPIKINTNQQQQNISASSFGHHFVWNKKQ